MHPNSIDQGCHKVTSKKSENKQGSGGAAPSGVQGQSPGGGATPLKLMLLKEINYSESH